MDGMEWHGLKRRKDYPGCACTCTPRHPRFLGGNQSMPFHSIQEKNGCGLDTGLAGDFEKSLSCPQPPSYESVRRSKRVGRVLRRPYRPTATYPYPHARERLHGPRRAFPRVPTPPMASTIGTPPMASTIGTPPRASTRAHATDGFHACPRHRWLPR